ncbi:MAG: helix-hairpin-helix domain-containing protein [Bacteroidales bacterium]
MKIPAFLIVPFMTLCCAHAQDTTLTLTNARNVLNARIEAMAENTEKNNASGQVLQDLAHLQENPISLNKASYEDLAVISLLSAYQIQHLLDYRKNYGRIYSYTEILTIPGFNPEILGYLRLLTTLSEHAGMENVNKRKKNIRANIFLRYSRITGKDKKYLQYSDQGIKEGATYLGSPDKLFFRANLTIRNKLSLGLVADKDAGEPMRQGKIPDSIWNATAHHMPRGFDFYSGYVALRDIWILEKIMAGNFHVRFGQGLTTWTTAGFGHSPTPSGAMKRTMGITPSTSSNENHYMRGLAFTAGKGCLKTHVFYSNASRDANVETRDPENGDPLKISSLQESGYHRTVNEIKNKNAVRMINWGGHAEISIPTLKLGISLMKTRLNATLSKPVKPCNLFVFQGRETFHTGLNYIQQPLSRCLLFGEFSLQDMTNIAFIQGLIFFHDRLELSLIFRHFSKKFFSFMNAPQRASSGGPETGIYVQLSIHMLPNWMLSIYGDAYRHPWLRYRVHSPSYGEEFSIQSAHTILKKSKLILTYRYKKQLQNITEERYINIPREHGMHRTTIQVDHPISPALIARTRITWINCTMDQPAVKNNTSTGTAFAQDILFRPAEKPLDLTLRWVMFHTDDYDARIYMYEHDVLYYFSAPSYYGTGIRAYAIARWKANRRLDLWLKISRTGFLKEPESLKKNGQWQKTEIRVQCRLHF